MMKGYGWMMLNKERGGLLVLKLQCNQLRTKSKQFPSLGKCLCVKFKMSFLLLLLMLLLFILFHIQITKRVVGCIHSTNNHKTMFYMVKKKNKNTNNNNNNNTQHIYKRRNVNISTRVSLSHLYFHFKNKYSLCKTQTVIIVKSEDAFFIIVCSHRNMLIWFC